MKILHPFLLGVMLLSLTPVSADDNPCCDFGKTTKEEQAKILERAVSSALKRMIEARLSIDDRIVVISNQGQYVVVSFVLNKRGVRGGGAHVVYSPKIDGVVYVLAED